jgi:AAA+ superfamily predicted ATPase|tara:strand:+ start:1215 stop:2564 length:1350 start_codon:yes stop_codon:yes gene_type:complete
MSQEIKIMTPMGEVSIPYSEDAIMVLAKKLVKVSGGEPNLLEEAVVEFIGIDDYESCDSDWLFWEDTHVPIYIYDMMKYIDIYFDIEKTVAYSMSKRKTTGIQYHQFDYPHGKEKMPIRATFFLRDKANGNPVIIDFTPLDGLHLEIQILHLPEFRIADFHKNYADYAAKEGILRNNTVDAKLQFINVDDVSWEDVVLTKIQRKALDKNIVKFIENLNLYEQKNLPTSRGCLLTGPPGTGKTLTCSAVMNQVEATIIYITSDDITERGQIGELYELARKVSPTIVVVEDIDTLGGLERTKQESPLLGEFLNCLAGVESNGGVITIATTNYPEFLDKALVDRPGRFDFRIDFGLPDEKLRTHILEKYLSSFNHQKMDLKPLVKDTDGMTGAHLKEMVMMAYMDALESSDYAKNTKITVSHLEDSMKVIAANRAKYNHYNAKSVNAGVNYQ